MCPVTSVDDKASGPTGNAFGALVDQESLATELDQRKNPNRKPHPFRAYTERVRMTAGVPDAQETREMCSHICGIVARLPFLPDYKEEIDDGFGGKTTEFAQQIIKTARSAESQLESEMVWTASALKLSRAALEIRKSDPDGKKGIAWVNDPLPGETRAAA